MDQMDQAAEVLDVLDEVASDPKACPPGLHGVDTD